MEVGDNELRKQQAIRQYCRHLIGLVVTYDPIDKSSEKARTVCYAAFLMYARKSLYLVTAGHILREMDAALNSNEIALKNGGLVDGFGDKAKHFQQIPFDFGSAPRLYVYNEELGLDFGLISLDGSHERLMNKNGVRAVPTAEWTHCDELQYEEYIILGIPTELIKDDTKPYTPLPVIIPLTKLDSAPEGHETPYERFVGRIFKNVTIESIEGMSGGPIFGIGVGPNGKKRHIAIAVQSGWLPKQRVTFGCPIPVFMDFLERAIAERREEIARDNE